LFFLAWASPELWTKQAVRPLLFVVDRRQHPGFFIPIQALSLPVVTIVVVIMAVERSSAGIDSRASTVVAP